MNLTTEDIQIVTQTLKAALQPEFDSLRNAMNKEFEEVNKRFKQVDKRFEKIDLRLENVERKIEQVDVKLEIVEQRLENIEISLQTIGEEVARNIMPIYITRDEHRKLEKRVDVLEQKVQN